MLTRLTPLSLAFVILAIAPGFRVHLQRWITPHKGIAADPRNTFGRTD